MRTTVQYREIWQLWKLSIFNCLLCDKLWLLSGILIALTAEGKWINQRDKGNEKRKKKQNKTQSENMIHGWPAKFKIMWRQLHLMKASLSWHVFVRLSFRNGSRVFIAAGNSPDIFFVRSFQMWLHTFCSVFPSTWQTAHQHFKKS